MLAKLSTLALALPLVSALTINSITGATSGSTVTITWTASTTDPAYFDIELQNPIFNNVFAIDNNVQTSLGSVTIELPQVPPGGDYSLVAYSTTNVNTTYSTSGTFSIGATSSSSTSAASTASVGSSTASVGTASSVTATIPASSAASSASAASTSSAASSPSALNSSAAPSFKLIGVAPAAALVLSAVAGAAMVF